MISGTADAHDQHRLYQHADGEGVHGETSRVDGNAQNEDDTLPIILALTVATTARRIGVGEKNSILSG